MTQLLDRPETVTCAKGTLWRVTRTCCLLMAAGVATVLLVDIPLPIGGAADRSPSYVPASDTWIELGPRAHAASPITAAALDPAPRLARQATARGVPTR